MIINLGLLLEKINMHTANDPFQKIIAVLDGKRSSDEGLAVTFMSDLTQLC
jgi:hypothetical protein